MKSCWKPAAACFWAIAALTVLTQHVLAQEPLSGQALVDALRQGGYVIYFRHAATDWSQHDQVTVEGEWTNCDPNKMRQLSDEGRAVARRIGEAIRRLRLPIGQVLSSEYCRTRETAQLMNLGPVLPTRNVMNMRVVELVGGQDAVVERAQRELGRPPKPGTNTVIVAHGNLMRAASGEYTDEAGAGIFEPRGGKYFKLVTLLTPENWLQLADQFARQ